MKLVVVESPGKAKPINKYLGSDYKVLASYGHVRDLPAKDGSVRPDEDFDMSWEVDGKAGRELMMCMRENTDKLSAPCKDAMSKMPRRQPPPPAG